LGGPWEKKKRQKAQKKKQKDPSGKGGTASVENGNQTVEGQTAKTNKRKKTGRKRTSHEGKGDKSVEVQETEGITQKRGSGARRSRGKQRIEKLVRKKKKCQTVLERGIKWDAIQHIKH